MLSIHSLRPFSASGWAFLCQFFGFAPSRPQLRQMSLAVLIAAGGSLIPPATKPALAQPLNGCTFYKPRLLAAFAGCAEHSAVRGRNGCRKVKGPCPACIHYAGDDVQMWLPDYYIEVTSHVGQSIFVRSADGGALAAHLQLGVKWWESATKAPLLPGASRGASSQSSAASFWQARILTIPYGAETNTYPPLRSSIGTGLPSCYSGMSEFLSAQWNFNLADGPYAAAWAPAGASLCLSILGGGIAAGADEAKRQVSKVAGGVYSPSGLPADLSCANPVGAAEAVLKDAQPSADTLAPLTDLSKLCMGSWGNLVPRTGWILSDDPYMSAMNAAYKFQSLAGDMHLNQALKLQADDKWQIVYPPRPGAGCFRPGSPIGALELGGDDPTTRAKEEVKAASVRKGHTYVIAVWRRRNSCEEPLESVGGWTAAYRTNFAKNQGLCQAVFSE